MIGFLTNPGSSLIRSLKSDPHPAFRSSCPFVFRLLRKNLVNPSIESYPARQRRSYSSAAGMARTSATIRNSPLTPPENQVSIPVKVKGNNNRDRSQPNYLKIAVASWVKRLLYLALHENDIMSPSGGIGRRVRFRCVCPRGRGGSSPLSGTFIYISSIKTIPFKMCYQRCYHKLNGMKGFKWWRQKIICFVRVPLSPLFEKKIDIVV